MYVLAHFSIDVAPYHVCAHLRGFPYLRPLIGSLFGGVTCQDRRGPRPERFQGRNEQDRTHKRTHSLRKGMTKHILRGPAG
jgi:hypothetical protein